MSLRNIKDAIQLATGINWNNTSDATKYLAVVNSGAYELYTALDLVGSICETIVRFDSESKIIALPYFVGGIRGVRWYSSPWKIVFNDIRPRYNNAGWGEQSLNWREIGFSPLGEEIDNYSCLKFTIPFKESSNITLLITGATENSAQITETLVLPANSLEVTTVNQFKTVESIRKAATNSYNITILDANDTVLGEIPNNQLSSSYQIVQIVDDSFTSSAYSNSGVECLFKRRWFPFVLDTDEFPCTGYDDAIVCKFLELYYAPLDGKREQRDYYKTKCSELIQHRYQDDAGGKEFPVEFGEAKFYSMHKSGFAFRKRGL